VGIDKTDLRVPAQTPFSEELRPIVAKLQYGPALGFSPSRFYRLTGDLRKKELYKEHIKPIEAVLHLDFRYGKGGHKLEIVDAGKKTLAQQKEIVRRVFDVDPDSLELMRVDLAADVCGVSVPWFREHSRFQFKHFASDIDKAGENEMEFIGMGNADAQSIYAGRRPNCVRIYNKVAELYRQWLKLKRACDRYNRGLLKMDMSEQERADAIRVAPTFDEFCLYEGFAALTGTTVTRVERQIGGDRFPAELRTFADLQHAHEFNPFAALQIIPNSEVMDYMSPPKGMPVRDWLALIGLQTMKQQLGGIQQAHAFVLKNGNGNGRRILESLLSQMPQTRSAVTTEEIIANYRKSTEQQIFGITAEGIYSGAEYEQTNEKAEAANV